MPRAESRAGQLLGVLADLISVLGPVASLVTFLFTGEASVPLLILAVYVCTLATLLLLVTVSQDRRRRYATALPSIETAFRLMAEVSYGIVQGKDSPEQFRRTLSRPLAALAQAFGIITGASCRVSIKLLSADKGDQASQPHDIEVVTLCRDDPELEDPPHERPDRVGENTDFLAIFVDQRDYFFSNDLIKLQGSGLYNNTHWSSDVIQNETYLYRSTIVWPIGRKFRGKTQGQDQPRVIGFLCIDSLEPGIFDRVADVPLGAAFAHAIFAAIEQFIDKDKEPPVSTPSSEA